MTTFLFWNLNEKPLGESLQRLVESHEVDVLMLAESSQVINNVPTHLEQLNGGWGRCEAFTPRAPRVTLWTRWPLQNVQARLDQPLGRWSISRLFPPNAPDILLVSVHLLSKREMEADEQADFCYELARDIREEEDIVGHRRTLVGGDFNLNPFEVDMIGAVQLHAEATRTVVEARESRKVQGSERFFFYNPMWNFLGDGHNHPGGSYFYEGSRPHRISWNVFDQFLLRPALLPCFELSNLEILTNNGQVSFLQEEHRKPGANGGSDHLPLLLKLDLSKLL